MDDQGWVRDVEDYVELRVGAAKSTNFIFQNPKYNPISGETVPLK